MTDLPRTSKEWNAPWRASGFAVYDAKGTLVAHTGITGNRSMPGAQLERMATMIAKAVNAYSVNEPRADLAVIADAFQYWLDSHAREWREHCKEEPGDDVHVSRSMPETPRRSVLKSWIAALRVAPPQAAAPGPLAEPEEIALDLRSIEAFFERAQAMRHSLLIAAAMADGAAQPPGESYTESDVMVFIGFLSAWLPELSGVEMGRFHSAWDEWLERYRAIATKGADDAG